MSSYTRRQFLEDSVLAAAVAAAFPAGGLMAAEEQKKNKKKEEPKKVKKSGDLLGVAIVGAGGRGGEHVPEYLANLHTEIVYIVDPDERHGQRFVEIVSKRQDRKPKFVRDLRVALGRQVGATSSRSPRPTTGTRWRPSGPCRPAKTSMSRSR